MNWKHVSYIDKERAAWRSFANWLRDAENLRLSFAEINTEIPPPLRRVIGWQDCDGVLLESAFLITINGNSM